MKITLCGSINTGYKMREIKKKLEEKGHIAILPKSLDDFNVRTSIDADKIKSNKKKYIDEIKPIYTKEHFNNVRNSDAVLVVNIKKNGIENYIGGATFAELMLAYHYNKKIFLLNPIPGNEKFDFIRDEIEATKPIILNVNLNLVK